MTPAGVIRSALGNSNLEAFLVTIRRRESSVGEDAWTMLYGGGHFTSFVDHPRQYFALADGRRTSAAGAFQIVASTWDALRRQYPDDLPDFSPSSQTFAAAALIAGRGALDDVLAGRFEQACEKLRPEWTSMPGAAEAGWDMAAAKSFYMSHGGRLDLAELITPAAPEPPKETSMPIPAIIGAIATFGPAIAQLIPILAPLFDKRAETPAKLAAASHAVEVIVQATGAVNEQDAVTRLAADPALVQQVTQKLVTDATIMPLLEISSAGIDKAREQSVQFVQAATHWWQLLLNPVLIVTVLTLPLIYIIVIQMVAYLDKVSGDVIAQTIGTVIGLVLGGIMGFWMGQTYQNSKAERRAGDAQPQGATK